MPKTLGAITFGGVNMAITSGGEHHQAQEDVTLLTTVPHGARPSAYAPEGAGREAYSFEARLGAVFVKV